MQISTRIRALAVTAVVIASATPGMAIAATARPARIVSHPHPSSRNEVGGPLLAGHGVVRYPARGGRPLPAVPASAYLIANASTGAVLAAKDAHGLFPPASTLKVLDLFRALLLISANDAAVALAQASGSFSKGIALMNAEARHLQAYDVVAKQPNGLPAAGQVVSAYDLALIARRALQMPAFMRYDSLRTARFPVKRHKHVLLINQNYLVTKYRGGLGGKIGWTLKAGATYVGMARRSGVTLIVTILHATPLTEITSAERLLNWGFAMSGQVRPAGGLVPPLSDARPVATRTHAMAPATGSSLAGVSARAKDEAAIGAGVAATVCACVLGGLACLRRRAMLGRRQSG